MPELAFKRREVKSERIYFIPRGAIVDSVTVAIATWPDMVPTSNWGDYQLSDIEMLKPTRKTESETFIVPADSGGYEENVEEIVVSNSWTADTALTNALLKQLEYGLAVPPVAGTAQTPYTRKENYIEGVLLKETQLRSTGAVTERLQCWARMYLVTPGDSGPKTSKLQVRFQKMASPNNTLVIIG